MTLNDLVFVLVQLFISNIIYLTVALFFVSKPAHTAEPQITLHCDASTHVLKLKPVLLFLVVVSLLVLSVARCQGVVVGFRYK